MSFSFSCYINIKLNQILYRFFYLYLFWGQYCCWTGIIVNDLFVFFMFPLPSTCLLPSPALPLFLTTNAKNAKRASTRKYLKDWGNLYTSAAYNEGRLTMKGGVQSNKYGTSWVSQDCLFNCAYMQHGTKCMAKCFHANSVVKRKQKLFCTCLMAWTLLTWSRWLQYTR